MRTFTFKIGGGIVTVAYRLKGNHCDVNTGEEEATASIYKVGASFCSPRDVKRPPIDPKRYRPELGETIAKGRCVKPSGLSWVIGYLDFDSDELGLHSFLAMMVSTDALVPNWVRKAPIAHLMRVEDETCGSDCYCRN